MPNSRFAGKVALVTNANYDIGASIARTLASKGIAVLITFLGAPSADGVVKHILDRDGHVASVEVDLSDLANIPLLFDYAEQEFGPVDILVNNIVVEKSSSVVDVRAVDFDRHVTTNVRVVMIAIAEYVRRYHQRGANWGRIINVISSADQYPLSGEPFYSATKGAIHEITRITASELDHLGITVNAVFHSPGGTKPRILTKLTKTPQSDKTHQPWTIADVVALLASEQAGSITGHIISVSDR